ncbi:MAG: zinc ribbon domain-containing protein [Kofleriaceae bacterium]
MGNVDAATAGCPKCGAARSDVAAACTKCGLVAARMETYAKDLDASIPEVLIAAWARAVESWDDPARHDEILRLATQHDAFAWVAARYRARGDDRQLARIRKAAEATMFATATTRKDSSPRPYRALTAVLIMLIIAAVGGLLYAMMMRGGDAPAESATPNATPAPPIPQAPHRAPAKN